MADEAEPTKGPEVHLDPATCREVTSKIAQRDALDAYLKSLAFVNTHVGIASDCSDPVAKAESLGVLLEAAKKGDEIIPAAELENAARDRWMSQQKDTGQTLTAIRLAIKQHPEWNQLDTEQAVSQAIKRYRQRIAPN